MGQATPDSFVHRWLFRLNLLIALGLLFSYLAPLVNPNTLWFLAFFGLFYPIWLFANIVFLLYWVWVQRRYFYVSLAVIVLGFSHFTHTINFNSSATLTGKELKILTYNVHYFDALENTQDPARRDTVVARILRYIGSSGADVVCAQEFSGDISSVSGYAMARMEQMGYPYKAQAEGGLTLFSKYPFLAKEAIDFEGTYNSALYADIQHNNKVVRIYNVHLQSIALGKDADKVMDTGQSKNFYRNVLARIKRAFCKRATQADILAEHIKQCPHPVVVCGDFNDTHMSYTYRRIKNAGGLNDAFNERGRGWGTTYSGKIPGLRIDFVLAQAALPIQSYKAKRLPYSDHKPVFVSLNP